MMNNYNNEAFHSLLIQFVPQNCVFGYTEMKCHSMLAALYTSIKIVAGIKLKLCKEGPYLK